MGMEVINTIRVLVLLTLLIEICFIEILIPVSSPSELMNLE